MIRVGCTLHRFALKFIFEHVDPKPIFGGRIVLQGLFLKRQPEVSAEFAEYMSANVLTSKKLWESILHGPRSGRVYDLLDVRLRRAITAACSVLKVCKAEICRLLFIPDIPCILCIFQMSIRIHYQWKAFVQA